MISSECHTVFFCPFKAEAALLAANIKDCRKINAHTWTADKIMIFTWNGAGFLPLQKFLGCFPLEELRTKKIYLFGSAGSLDDKHQPGQIFSIDKVKFESNTTDLPSINGIPSITSMTKSTPVLSSLLRESMFERHGSCLIDQESFHFVEYFKNHLIETSVIRFVSDTPSFDFKLPFPKVLTNRFSMDWKLLRDKIE